MWDGVIHNQNFYYLSTPCCKFFVFGNLERETDLYKELRNYTQKNEITLHIR